MTGLEITDVRLVTTGDQDRAAGLAGYVSVTVAESLVLDGITLRRTADHRWALSFPARTDRRGTRHPYFRPVTGVARRSFEAQVLRALGLLESQA
ncbi:MAG: hypothetical protein U1F36_08315 [Planctomycetota bacterium]